MFTYAHVAAVSRPAPQAFATFGDAINTCFEILLGNIDVNSDLRALGGLQSVAGALWFWSYELLVYMVLLNFLLAIIVDAFSEVKEKTHETVGIHTELFQLMRDKWRSLLGSFSPNYISDAKLGDLLRQWAGEGDDKDDSPEVREEKRKLLTVSDPTASMLGKRPALRFVLPALPHWIAACLCFGTSTTSYSRVAAPNPALPP